MTETMSSDETHAGAQHFCSTVRSAGGLGPKPRVLVAGCGKGHEALFIRGELGGSVVGVDISEQWDSSLGADVPDFRLTTGSILELAFADGSFDAVFYHHVIEHVDDPAGSLRELARVLRPGGLIYVGTPNRHRAVGYPGPSKRQRWRSCSGISSTIGRGLPIDFATIAGHTRVSRSESFAAC
jgi:ubiquinone/menaquinone biosynthesis C-methylase UbiE